MGPVHTTLSCKPRRGPSTLYCSVTRTWMTPFPSRNGSSAFPTTAPNIRVRFIPFIAYPGVEDVTSKSPGAIGPFSAETLHGTMPTTARGISSASASESLME